MDQSENRDSALFEALDRKKKKKRRKIIRTVILVIVLLAGGLTFGTLFLRRRVRQQFSGKDQDVTSAAATRGSISTQVSGSGTLLNVDEEDLDVPAGVKIEEVVVSAHDAVKKGDVLAKVNTVSVLAAMDALQEDIQALDKEIYSAGSDTVDSLIRSGVEGRVKKIYAQSGTEVVSCMAEYGALALLSLDGKMAVEIETSLLQPGESVRVARADNTELAGTVESVAGGIAVILVTDDGTQIDESVIVMTQGGSTVGFGRLNVHSPLRISGISGTVSYVHVTENQLVYSGSSLFSLRNTSYYARYQTLLSERAELEETLLELMELYRNGAVLAPYDGSVSSVNYDKDSVTDDSETPIVTFSPDISMQVTINVDESNILSLELGQTAQVTVSSVGDESFPGTVTEINKTANSASGVTRYSAVVTLAKVPEMLQGMSAKAVVRIQGVEDAVLIPIDALHQTSSSSFVYTSYDEEMQEFGGLVPVTVGITNSSYAEITSGLQEGDTVYYTESQTNPFGGNFGGGMPNMGSGGNFGGDGRERPNGGNFGGDGRERPNGGNFGGPGNSFERPRG